MSDRLFYTEDWDREGLKIAPREVNLAYARDQLRSALLAEFRQDTDKVVRLIDRLIEAHVTDYSYKNPQSYSTGPMG